jgi:hypothetical protein
VVASVAAGGRTMSLIPVLALDFRVTPASMQSLANKARTSGELLTVIEVIVPVALVVLGVVLLVIAVLRRRRPAPAAPAGIESTDAPQPDRADRE